MRYLIALLVLSGCTDFSKLSAGGPDLAEPVRTADLAGVDLAGKDLADGDLALPSDGGVVAADMAKPDGMTETTDMAAPCIGSLANIGTTNFAIRFKITTTAQVDSTVMYQRSDCGLPTSDFWELTMRATGTLAISMGGVGASDYSTLNTTTAVNDGTPHEVVFTHTSGKLSSTTDGTASGVATSSLASFGSLSPLGIASGDPCGAAALVGTITDVCLQAF